MTDPEMCIWKLEVQEFFDFTTHTSYFWKTSCGKTFPERRIYCPNCGKPVKAKAEVSKIL